MTSVLSKKQKSQGTRGEKGRWLHRLASLHVRGAIFNFLARGVLFELVSNCVLRNFPQASAFYRLRFRDLPSAIDDLFPRYAGLQLIHE
jgi:hypothetical protein